MMSPFNNEILENHTLAKILEITSSLAMDFGFFALFLHWIMWGKTSRFLFTLLMFYAIRAIN